MKSVPPRKHGRYLNYYSFIIVCLFFFPLVIDSPCYAQKRSTGLILDDVNYQHVDQLAKGLSFTDPPNSYSLKKYAPIPGNQGQAGSCVSWASGYAALSMSLAIQLELPDSNLERLTRSPMFIYNQTKFGSCEEGSSLVKALDFLKQKGTCSINEFNPKDCTIQPDSNLLKIASEFKVKEVYRLFDKDASQDDKVIATIQSIASNKPVIIGMKIKSSLFKVNKSGNYKPSPTEQDEGGHAMCVVGYDQKKQVFEILNSWGPQYANQGYFYISYQDYALYTMYAFQLVLNRMPPSNLSIFDRDTDSLKTASRSIIQGEFMFKKYRNEEGYFEEMNTKYQTSYYELPFGICDTNSFFRVRAQNLTANTYVYVFSLKPNNTVDLLFPTYQSSDSISMQIPIIPNENVTIEIPENRYNGLRTDQLGEDYLCILYSEQKLNDLSDVLNTIRQSTGNLEERLELALGDRLISKKDIVYSSEKMKVIAKVTSGYIAPLILKVQVK